MNSPAIPRTISTTPKRTIGFIGKLPRGRSPQRAAQAMGSSLFRQAVERTKSVDQAVQDADGVDHGRRRGAMGRGRTGDVGTRHTPGRILCAHLGFPPQRVLHMALWLDQRIVAGACKASAMGALVRRQVGEV